MFTGQTPDEDRQLSSIASIFQHVLGEPREQSLYLADSWRKNQQAMQKHFLQSAGVTLDRSLQYSEQIQMEDAKLASQFINSCQSGIAIVTIHMGDYLHAILKLLSMIKKRQILVVRHSAWSSAEQSIQKLSAFGHEVNAILNSQGAARSVVKALRGGAIVILLFDLSFKWGATKPVHLLNNNLNWVCGPILLSLMGRCCLIPMFAFKEKSMWKCHLEAVRDYRHVNGDRGNLLRAEMQSLARMAEGYIRANVTQWQHWHLLPEMMETGVEQIDSRNCSSVR